MAAKNKFPTYSQLNKGKEKSNRLPTYNEAKEQESANIQKRSTKLKGFVDYLLNGNKTEEKKPLLKPEKIGENAYKVPTGWDKIENYQQQKKALNPKDQYYQTQVKELDDKIEKEQAGLMKETKAINEWGDVLRHKKDDFISDVLKIRKKNETAKEKRAAEIQEEIKGQEQKQEKARRPYTEKEEYGSYFNDDTWNRNNYETGRGNIDLNGRTRVNNPDGSFSTERSFSVNINGKEVLLPTVINGKTVSEDEAIEHYYRTGEHLGQFDTVEEAEKYAEALHNRQEKVYSGRPDAAKTWDANTMKADAGISDVGDKNRYMAVDELTEEEMEAIRKENAPQKSFLEASMEDPNTKYNQIKGIIEYAAKAAKAAEPNPYETYKKADWDNRGQAAAEALDLENYREYLNEHWNDTWEVLPDRRKEAEEEIAKANAYLENAGLKKQEAIGQYTDQSITEAYDVMNQEGKLPIYSAIPEDYKENKAKYDKELYDYYYGEGAYYRTLNTGTDAEKQKMQGRIHDIWADIDEVANRKGANEFGSEQDYDNEYRLAESRKRYYEDQLKEIEYEEAAQAKYLELINQYNDDLTRKDFVPEYDQGGQAYTSTKENQYSGPDTNNVHKIYSFLGGGIQFERWASNQTLQGRNTQVSPEYSYAMMMTNGENGSNDEIGIFMNLYNKAIEEGREPVEAQAFFDGLQQSLRQRYEKAEEIGFAEVARQIPGLGSMATLIAQQSNTLLAIPRTVAGWLGDESVKDQNSWWYYGSKMKEGIQGEVAENIGGVGGKIYTNFMNTANNMLNALTTPGGKSKLVTEVLGLGKFFLQVYQDSTYEHLKETDYNTATGLAALDAMMETAEELLPYDTMLESGGKSIVHALIASMGSEAMEELTGATLGETIKGEITGYNPILKREDEILNQGGFYDDKGNWQALNTDDKTQMIAQADVQALKEFRNAAIENALGGAFGGGVGGTFGTVQSAFGMRSARNEMGKTALNSGIQEDMKNGEKLGQQGKNELMMFDAASKMGENSEAAKLAKKLKQKLYAGKKVSNAEFGKLIQTIAKESNEQITKITADVLQEKVKNDLKEKYGDMEKLEVDYLSGLIAKKVAGLEMSDQEKFDYSQSDLAKEVAMTYGIGISTGVAKYTDMGRVSEAAIEIGEKTKEYESAAKSVLEMAGADFSGQNTEEAVNKAVEGAKYVDPKQIDVLATGERSGTGMMTVSEGKVSDAASIVLQTVKNEETGKNERRFAVTMADGRTVDISGVQATTQGMAQALQFLQNDQGQTVGENLANTILQIAGKDTSGNVAGQITGAMRVMWAEATETKANITGLTKEQAAEVQQAVQKDLDAAEEKRLQGFSEMKPGQGKTTFNGAEYGTNEFNNAVNKLGETNRKEAQAIGSIAKSMGVNVELYYDTKDTANQGSFTPGGGIRINLAGTYTKEGAHRSALATFGHEVTHWEEANSRDGYNALKKFIFNNLKETFNLQGELQRIIDNYREHGEDLDLNGAIAELVAKGCEQILTDEKVIRQLKQQDAKLAGSIRSTLEKLIGRVRGLKGEAQLTSSRYAKAMMNVGEELAQKWMAAYEEAKGAKGTAKGNKEQQHAFRDSEGNELTITENEIISNRAKVKEMDPVITVNTDDYSSILEGGFVEEGYKVLTKDGKTAENSVIGTVELAKSGLRHVTGRGNVAYVKAMAIPAIRSTIEKGEIVLIDNDGHNAYDSVVIAAKAKMPNGTYYVGVLVSQDHGGTKGQQNRYSFHAALIIKENAAAMDSTELMPDELPKGYDSVPVFRVLQAIANSNVQNGKKQNSMQEEDEEGARLLQERNDAYNKYTDLRLEISKLKGELDEINKRIMAAETEEETNALVEEITAWNERTGYSRLQEELKAAEEAERKARKAYDEYAETRDVAEEQKKIKESGMTEEDWRRKQAVNQFGYTTNYKEAGYLLPDGKMLNFSGEKGRHYGTRGSDHREIGTVYASGEMQGSAAMMAFMNDGNIRVMAETPGIDISTAHEPTTAQMNQIRNMASRFADEEYFSVDLTDKNGNTVGNLEYEGRINPSRVVNDIRHYFQTGEIREQSAADRFHYSIQDETEMDVGAWMAQVSENSLQTEAEKQLLRQYKGWRTKLDLYQMDKDEIRKKMKLIEEVPETQRTKEQKKQLKTLQMNEERAQTRIDEALEELAKASGEEGFARMMYQQSQVLNNFIYGRSQAEVRDAVEAMEKNAQAVAKRIDENRQAISELEKSGVVQQVKKALGRTTAEQAAAELKKEFHSTWTKNEILNYLNPILLKMSQGEDISYDVEELAGILINSDSRNVYDELSGLRGLTITLGKGQQKELKARNSSLKEIRARLAGTGITVKYGDRSTLEADIDNLRAEYPNIPELGDEKDALENFVSWVEGMKQASGAQEFYDQQLAETMSIIMQKAAGAMSNLYIPAEGRAQKTVLGLIEYVKTLRAETEQYRQDLEKVAAEMDRMQKAGATATGMVNVLHRDVNIAIDYYNKMAKIAEDTAKQKKQSETIRQLKSEHAQQILKNNEEWRKLLERDKEAREQEENNRATRGQINTVVKRLYNWLKNPKDLKNVPEHMQGLAREVIETLVDNDLAIGKHRSRKLTQIGIQDLLEIKRVLTAWKEQNGEFNLADLNEAAQDDAMHIVNQDLLAIYDGIAQYNGKVRGKNRPDILKKRGEILKGIQAAVSEIYQYIRAEQTINLNNHRYAISDQAYKVAAKTGGKQYREWTGKAGRAISTMHKAIVSGNMTPEYFFRTLENEGLSELWEEYHRAENRNGLELKKAQTRLKEIADQHGYGTWDVNQQINLQLASGDVKITLGQLMSLYATWKREQQLGPEMSEHLTKGGFYVEDTSTLDGLLGRKAMDKRAHRVTEADMEKVSQILKDEQKAYIDDVVSYMSNDMSELGNEASMKAYGIRLYKEKYYFPFQMWEGVKNRKSNDAGKGASGNQAFHPSFSKSRLHGAQNALVLGDFTQTAADHIAGMINYATMGLANENLNKVLNFQVDEGTDMTNFTKRNVRAIIEEAYGQEALKYLMDLKVQLEGGAVKVDKTFYDKLISLFRKNAVAGSLSVALQQPLSYIRAATMINAKYLARAISPDTWKGSYKEMLEHSGVAVIKDMGRFDMNFGQSAREFLMPDAKEKAAQKVWGFITDKATILPEMMDRMTWTRMWSAVKAEQKAQHPDMDVKSDAFLDMCGERFNDIMRRTQVYDSVLVKSANMRNQNPGVKMITSFMAEPTLTMNVLADAFMQAKRGNKGGKALAAKAAATFLLSAIMQAAVKGLFGAERNPDDKKNEWENFLYRFWSALISEADPLTLIPGYSTAVDLMKGSDISDNALGAIGKMFDAGKTGIDAILGNKSRGAYRDIEDSVAQIVQLFTNLPAKNLMRDARAMHNFIAAKMEDTSPFAWRETSGNVLKYQGLDLIHDADNLMGVINKYLGEAGYKTDTKGYYKRVYQAMKNDDKEKEQGLIDYLLNGKGVKKEDSIWSGVKTIIKDEYEDEKITRSEAEKLMRKADPGIEDKDLLKTLDKIDYEKDGGEDESYSNYTPVEEAIEKGSAADLKKAKDYLIKNGYKESDVNSQIKSIVKKRYKAGDTTKAQLEKELKEYAGITDKNDLWWEVDRAEFSKETGESVSADAKNYRLKAAMENNSIQEIRAAVQLMLKHGMEKSGIRTSINNTWKERYMAADNDGKRKIRNAIQQAYKALGYTAADADKVINGWKKKK